MEKIKKSIHLLSPICTIAITITALVHVSLAQNSPQDYVKAHNAVRAEAGVAPIAWNLTLATKAQNLADQRVPDCFLKEGLVGENIAMASYPLTGVEAVRLWANEKRYYDPVRDECGERNCYHYRLVAVNGTVTVGCARAQCRNGIWFVSCSYYSDGILPI